MQHDGGAGLEAARDLSVVLVPLAELHGLTAHATFLNDEHGPAFALAEQSSDRNLEHVALKDCHVWARRTGAQSDHGEETEAETGEAHERFDVMTKQSELVFDAASQYGSGVYLWQHHSSDDDAVQSATLRRTSDYANLGCPGSGNPKGCVMTYNTTGPNAGTIRPDRPSSWR